MKYEEIKAINKAESTTVSIELVGEVLEDVTLKNLRKQAGKESDFETLILEIASPGGSVSEGLKIMVWLDSLSKSGKKIITIVTANAYSIASLIMLVADYRVISIHGEVMVHNPMIPELKYANADKLLEYAAQLRDLESMLYSLYEVFTGLPIEKIKELMDNETYISPHQALNYGFVDEILDVKQRPYEMVVNTKIINMSKTLNALNRVIAKVTQKEFVDQLYYTNDGGEIEIYQKDASTYSLKDKTNKENGEFIIADGSTLTVENYAITNITKEAIAKEVEEKEIEKPVAKVETENPVEEIKVEEKEEVQEIEVENKAVETVEIVEEIETVEAKEIEVETEVEVEPEYINELKTEIANLKTELSDLKEVNGNINSELSEIKKFEAKATQAIEDLANKTVSDFKPSPKVKVELKKAGTSIFDRARKEVGLK